MSSNLTFNFNNEYNDTVDVESYQNLPPKMQEKTVRLYWNLIEKKTIRKIHLVKHKSRSSLTTFPFGSFY